MCDMRAKQVTGPIEDSSYEDDAQEWANWMSGWPFLETKE